jgi:methionine synthase II (cobalamin-independent)
LVPRPGINVRRAHELLARDLDAVHDVAEGYTGPLKVQATGPWTLAAALERTRGDRAVVDPGARRDLAQSLAEGVAAHVAAVAARVPGARLVVQLDEPSLPDVLEGSLPTISGFGKLPAVEETVVERELAAVVAAVPHPVVVHCCTARAPIGLFRAAGAEAVSVDSGLVQDLDAVGTAVQAGTHLVVGVVPGTDAALPAPKATASRIQALWRELGFPEERLPDAVTLSPACGLAGATGGYARQAMRHVREAATYLQPE